MVLQMESYTRKYIEELPEDTVVYHCAFTNVEWMRYRVETAKEYTSNIDHLTMEFLFHHKDGLWASYGARNLWDRYPYLHPHYTLFHALSLRFPIV